jgi:hypothetical protein
MVQKACIAPLEEMAQLIALPGRKEAKSATGLLKFLQLDPLEFDAAFSPEIAHLAPGASLLQQYQASHPRCDNKTFHKGSIGLPGRPWLKCAVELELWANEETTAQVKAENATALLQKAEVVKHVLNHTHSSNNSTERDTIRSLHIKKGHDSHDVLSHWNWERENNRGMLELASPCNLSEDEAMFVSRVFDEGKFREHFYPGDSFHIHVDTQCMEKDERKLVGLLLLWEHFHDTILELTNSRRKGIPTYAAKIADKSPALLAMLQQRWLNSTVNETLTAAYRRLEPTLKLGRDRHMYLAPKKNRDGYRDMAINVCHHLDVKCCLDCEKNNVKKFHALEFRAFDAAFPESILLISLAQRLVQASCEAPADVMQPLLELPGVATASDALPLLKFLELDPKEFSDAFPPVHPTAHI